MQLADATAERCVPTRNRVDTFAFVHFVHTLFASADLAPLPAFLSPGAFPLGGRTALRPSRGSHC